MSKAFASRADIGDKVVSFTRLSEHAYAYTAQGDPNTGVIIGDEAVMVVDTQATPVMASDVIARIRTVTDKPVRYIVLTHYHAVRVLGASAYGADHIIASEDTRALIVERGEQDYRSEYERFPRLFRGSHSIPGLTWPNLTFTTEMTVRLGDLEVRLLQPGRGHTLGDTVAWLPQERVLFSGDLVEYGATPYMGDAYLRDWPRTLDNIERLQPLALVPGRGDALSSRERIAEAFAGTRGFVTALFESVRRGKLANQTLEQVYRQVRAELQPRFGHWVIFDHCLPFDVARAYDEAGGIEHPRIWTAERDAGMWQAIAAD